MLNNEFLSLAVAVLGSWQVIAVSLVVLAYLGLVLYVARLHRPDRSLLFRGGSAGRRQKAEVKPAPPPSSTAEVEIEDE